MGQGQHGVLGDGQAGTPAVHNWYTSMHALGIGSSLSGQEGRTCSNSLIFFVEEERSASRSRH
jgi:hypothetical protein